MAGKVAFLGNAITLRGVLLVAQPFSNFYQSFPAVLHAHSNLMVLPITETIFCETSTSTCPSLATISSGLYRFPRRIGLINAKMHTSSPTT